jgi:excisionase family DNA binding protein
MAKLQLSQGLSKQQAAKMLSISVASVDRAIARGDLPAYRVGGVIRILEHDLANFQLANPIHVTAS